MNLDRETTASLREAEALRNMVQSEGWQLAKTMLLEQIGVLDSVSSLPTDISFEEIGKQAMFRAHAISLVRGWLELLEGKVEQGHQHREIAAELVIDPIYKDHSISA